MKITSVASNQFAISVNEAELATLCNCLNEVCNGIHVFEFATRLGAAREEVLSMLDALLAALDAPTGDRAS
ncbi:MAG: hypothetical protein J0H14_01705 [Alphaproteobacteria bacterium]|nr:hypothetical protein [Alphaproteobacteria bacterium]